MKNIIILFAIVLVGAGATAGALTSASLGWTLKSVDEIADFVSSEEQQSGNITLELPEGPLVWIDPDETTIEFGNISVELYKPITGDILLSIDAGLYPMDTNITITLENTGSETAYFYGPPYHWIIDKYTDGAWKRIYPNGIELMGFFVTQIGSGEKEVDIWDQKIFDDTVSEKVQVDPGDFRVVIDYCMGKEKYEFMEYVYFSISNYMGVIDVEPAENITLELPGYPAVLKDQENILVPFPPLQTMPLEDIFSRMPIAEIALGECCNTANPITTCNATIQ